MKRALSITLSLLSWTAILVYLIVATRYCRTQQSEVLCKGLRVKVLDSAQRGFITSAMVHQWFATENRNLKQEELNRINTLDIEAFVRRRGFVKSAKAYTSIDGMLNIELTQRVPIMRINTLNGYDFYVTDDNYILPTQRYHSVYVPVVTGTLIPPFAPNFVGSLDPWAKSAAKDEKKVSKNYLFLANLINFVKFVESDPFWNAFWVQINIRGTDSLEGFSPQIELVPRAGDQIIVLGALDNYQEKLEKLMSFYQNAVAYEGWQTCRYINLAYRGQVVCSQE